MRRLHRGGTIFRSAFSLFAALVLAVPVHGAFGAAKVKIQEILTTRGSADIGQTKTQISLLDDDHKDTVIRVRGPSLLPSVWHVLFFADDSFLVPVERPEDPDVMPRNFMFDGEVRGDCLVKDVRFFRKLAEDKVIGFYAIQSTLRHELSGTVLVHEVFRFDRRESNPIWDYPLFTKIAERRTTAQACEQRTSLADLLKLVRDH